LTGDLGREGELAILKNTLLNHIQIWKAAHHGSKTSNSIELLNIISPEVIVISAGKNNKYHLPSPEILKRFNTLNAKIYRTDLSGTVDFRINSMKYYEISS
jgi:competence protein ComEC